MPWESTCIQEQFICVAISALYKTTWLWNSHDHLFNLIAQMCFRCTGFINWDGEVQPATCTVYPEKKNNTMLLCGF